MFFDVLLVIFCMCFLKYQFNFLQVTEMKNTKQNKYLNASEISRYYVRLSSSSVEIYDILSTLYQFCDNGRLMTAFEKKPTESQAM